MSRDARTFVLRTRRTQLSEKRPGWTAQLCTSFLEYSGFSIKSFRMKPSLFNALLLGLSHAEDDSNDVVNFKIESCNAADKEVPFIETFVQ